MTGATGTDGNRRAVKWMSIVGARPQFIKLGPVCRAIDEHNRLGRAPLIKHVVVHTGQHYDHEVSALLFDQLALPKPTYQLAAGSGTIAVQLARMIARLEGVVNQEKPDWVVVYGDTNSTLAGALLAARMKFPLAHVEAGCRSSNLEMPEEQNRIVADHLSRLLLTPSQSAEENLRKEGIGVPGDRQRKRVVVVGDVMYDALLQNLGIADKVADAALEELGVEAGDYYLLTIHRAENTDHPDRLQTILRAASSLELPVLFPVHPRTKHVLTALGITPNGSVRCVNPLGYLEMLALSKRARKILTDSGGVQKEAFYLRVPCVTLRDRTEWPETVELGANRLAGDSVESIQEAVFSTKQVNWSQASPYGDGASANRIVCELLNPFAVSVTAQAS